MAFGSKQFHCQMSCDHEPANEWVHCSGKNASYITIYFLIAGFGQIVLKVNTRGKFIPVTKVCASCTEIRKLSSPSGVAVPSQVITAKRFALTSCPTNSAIVDFILITHSLTEQVID